MLIRNLGMCHAVEIWCWCNPASDTVSFQHACISISYLLKWVYTEVKLSGTSESGFALRTQQMTVVPRYPLARYQLAGRYLSLVGPDQLVDYTVLSCAKISWLEWDRTCHGQLRNPNKFMEEKSIKGYIYKKKKGKWSLGVAKCWQVGKYSGEVSVWACSSHYKHWPNLKKCPLITCRSLANNKPVLKWENVKGNWKF